MTIKDCIDIVDNAKPNQYTIKEKVMWLSFIEAIIINEVLKTHEGYDGRYDLFEGYSEEKLSQKLIVPSPYDRLYTQYLKMKIDEENGETTRYNNSAVLYNNYMAEYKKYYNKTHMPIDVTNKCKPAMPKIASVGLSDAEYESIKKDLTFILTEYFSDAVSPDKIADAVTKFAQNNMEMLKGKDGRDGLDGKDGYTPRKNIDYFDGKIGPQGPKGEQGPQGEQGPEPSEELLKTLVENAIPKGIQTVTDLGEITVLDTDLFFALNKKENEYVTFTTKGMLTKNNGDLIIGGATANTETATYTAFSSYQGEDGAGDYYKQIYIFDSNYSDTFGIYTTGLIFASNGIGVTTTYNRFVAFEDYINALELTVSNSAVFSGNNVRFTGMVAPVFEQGFNVYGPVNFQTLPQMVDYRGQKEADFMVIKDLGEITTQEQLDALQHLPTGYAKFKSKYGVYANDNTFVLSDEVHHGAAYFEYLLETIQSPTEYVVQFLKTSNYSQLQPMFIFRRYHRVALGNGTYSISNYSSGNFLANGDSLNFTNGVLTDAGEFTMNALRFLINGAVEFSDNAMFKGGALFSSGNVMFDVGTNVSFWHPPKTRNKIAAKEVPIAYTAEYRGLSDETNPVFAFSYGAMDTDTVYGVIESLTLEWSVFPGLSGDSSIGIHFDTGDTPPSISYSIPHGNGETLNWIGTDCALQDGLSIFAPSANKHYDIYIYNNGTQYVAMVNGFTPATAN